MKGQWLLGKRSRRRKGLAEDRQREAEEEASREREPDFDQVTKEKARREAEEKTRPDIGLIFQKVGITLLSLKCIKFDINQYSLS